MIDGFDMWCATSDDSNKYFLSIREILGIEENDKVEEYYVEIFNLIEKYSSKYFVMEFIGCALTYELDHSKKNTSTNFVLKCTNESNRVPIKFVRKKKRSRKEERKVLNEVINLKIRKDFMKEEEEE